MQMLLIAIMFLLRSYGPAAENPQFMERVFAAQERHPGLIEEIWFSGCGDEFGKIEDIKREAARLNLGIKTRCEQLGIHFSYQQGVTLNHGPDGVRRDSFPEDAWVVDREGKVQYGLFCCTSPAVKDFCRDKAKAIMEALKPVTYWPDDDLRMNKLPKAPSSCFCKRCLKLFGDSVGRTFDRESLLDALTGPNASPELRRAWCLFNGKMLGEYAKVFREAADAVSPSTRVCQQSPYAANGVNGDAYKHILAAFNGQNVGTGVRPGGGYYSDQDPFALLYKGVCVARDAARTSKLPYVQQISYEAENWPHIGALKSPGGMMAESAYVIALGCDSIALYWGADLNGESAESYDFFFDTAAAWKPFLTKLRDSWRGTLPGGVACFIGEGRFATDNWISTIDCRQSAVLSRNGLPMADQEAYPDVFCLNEAAVKSLDKAELGKVFSKPVLMDVASFNEFSARFPTTEFINKVRIARMQGEKALATNKRMCGFERFGAHGKCEGVKALIYPQTSDVERISAMTVDADACGTCIIPTEFGGKVVLIQDMKFEAPQWAGHQQSWAGCRRHGILDALDQAVPGKMPVRILNDGYSCVVVARKTPDGRTAGAFVLNMSTGETPPLDLEIRRGSTQSWQLIQLKERSVAIGETANDSVRIKLPPLKPYGVVAVVPMTTPSASLGLVPMPREIELLAGSRVISSAEISKAVASYQHDASIPQEGYRLDVDADKVQITASDNAGAFYAGQTLRQLKDDAGCVPYTRIVDAPKFSWRGVMLDESRHFFGKQAVIKLLDTMAAYKLNVLHWHLTDNQGWRLPIPEYPELTRTVRPVDNRRNFRDVVTGIVPPEAYTREEILEIVQYAAKLHIRVVPEIDMPGHSAAVLSVEHELGCFPPQEFAGGGPADKVRDVLCPGRDEVLRFYEKVIDTVCELFPDPVVHLGGDECDRSNWKRCAKCQARMKKHGLKDVAELQAWFTDYFCKYLAKKNRRLLGWDEIAEGGLPSSAMVMSWRGTSTGIAAAKNGQNVVMTPNEYCYFDYDPCIEGDRMAYNFNWAIPLPMVKVYAFDPLKGIPTQFHSYVLGAQCNNWTEMTCAKSELEWKLWPRALAMAEVLWSYPAKRDFTNFVQRAEICRARLINTGVNAGAVRRHSGLVVGEITRTGNRINYKSGNTSALIEIVDGELVFELNGQRVRSFKKDGAFEELEILKDVDGAYFVTARRKGSELVVTFRLEGECVIAKDRWDWGGADNHALDIQALIDSTAAKGGGEVLIPAGRWNVKPFELRSNITLRLDDRAEIYASTDIRDYSSVPGKRCVVYAENATNIAIIGKGLFYGYGYRFRQLEPLPGESQPQALPVMMRFSRCHKVKLEDFTLCSCGAWACHLRNCDGAIVRRVKCLNHVNNTNDGLDIESSNVLVEDCDIDTDDDAVCLKSESDPTFVVTNVVVRNCRLSTCANAFKIGTGTYGSIRDVLVENCRFERPKANYGWILYKTDPGVTNRLVGMSGIALECIDGGQVENVTVRDITMEGYATPIFIRAQRRHEPILGQKAYLRNILVENVKGVADGRIASSITGVDGLRPQDITIRNVDLLMPGGGTVEEANAPVPESERVYPDAHMFNHQALPAWGFYIRHADNVRFEKVNLRLATPDARKKIVQEDSSIVETAR